MSERTDPSIPVVKVTLDDIYAELLSIGRKVDAMEGQKEDIADHEQRLRVLEKWVWGAAGLATLGGAGLGQVFAKFLGN